MPIRRCLAVVFIAIAAVLPFSTTACAQIKSKPTSQSVDETYTGPSSSLTLPAPYSSKGVSNESEIVGWPKDKMPLALPGFRVSAYAKLQSPRWLYTLPNGDVLVSQAASENSPDKITLLQGLNPDGSANIEKNLITKGLNRPFGMIFLNQYLYVADMDKIVRYRYTPGQKSVPGQPEKILTFPAGGYHGHWTRNLIASPDGKKIYISVGSFSNNGEAGMEKEARRAAILEINPDGSGERIFASGLRNPIGTAFYPGGNALWTVVNERDWLGDNLVPDYLTHVEDGGFYGWPYAYFGPNEDPRLKGQRPDLVAKTLVPDYSLGAHTASLGLIFYQGTSFPQRYRYGAFIGQHGSWNRAKLSGYKVAYIPFENGKPYAGPVEDFLTGFIAFEGDVTRGAKSQVYGRPVGVVEMKDGSILVADDAGHRIWRVAPASH